MAIINVLSKIGNPMTSTSTHAHVTSQPFLWLITKDKDLCDAEISQYPSVSKILNSPNITQRK